MSARPVGKSRRDLRQLVPGRRQPYGYGLYADNAFLRGHFLLTTGEDVATKFEVMENTIRTSIESVRNDFTTGESFLNNPNFGDGMRYWDTNNDIRFFTLGGKYLWLNSAPYSTKGTYAAVEEHDGRTVMCINNNYILQRGADFKTRPSYEAGLDGLLKAKPVFLTFFYRCLESGTLDIVFDGSIRRDSSISRSSTFRKRLRLVMGTGRLRAAVFGTVPAISS